MFLAGHQLVDRLDLGVRQLLGLVLGPAQVVPRDLPLLLGLLHISSDVPAETGADRFNVALERDLMLVKRLAADRNGAERRPDLEIPPGLDPSSVFLARISIPAAAGASGQPPTYNLNNIVIDNFSRLFLYPSSLVARVIGLTSGAES